jgi:uncharacterized SAM-binding protein YcdF (DUF218 family)
MNLIVILGEKLPKNGHLNKILQNRLDKGKDLYHDSLIVVSGGRVQKECIHTEAYVMKKYLMDEYKIPSDKIIQESRSQNTIENAKYTLKIIQQRNIQFDKMIVVSSSFHLKRVSNIFKYFYQEYNRKGNLMFISSDNGLTGKKLKDRIEKEKLYLQEFKDEYQC